MVAVVVGARLGLEQTSGWVLGGRGLLGQSSVGRAGENLFVNAATGNLVITRQDEFLIGRGSDSAISRTYNSRGGDIGVDLDNGDGWRNGAERRLTLAGTENTVGSTITRSDWDGSQVVYSWDQDRAAYVTYEGAGAYDTIKKINGVWTWTDGDTHTLEKYGEGSSSTAFHIVSRTDKEGHGIAYTYNAAGLLDRVTVQDDRSTAPGENDGYTQFVYYAGTNNLKEQVDVTPVSHPAITRVLW